MNGTMTKGGQVVAMDDFNVFVPNSKGELTWVQKVPKGCKGVIEEESDGMLTIRFTDGDFSMLSPIHMDKAKIHLSLR